MSLYLKYRPTTLDEVRGNEITLDALRGLLKDVKKAPHAYLLHGEYGCGKTTIARIIAKMLDCTDDDIVELNNADVRGIDTIREIIRQSEFMRKRVWIIDEVHMATTEAQNAMLKILEDTPKFVYFILCTTNPNKLLAAIKSRCQQFPVRTLDDEEMTAFIRYVARQENERIASELTEEIVRSSQGHPRNALQILEQVLSVDEKSRITIARQVVVEEQVQSIELCRALIKKQSWRVVSDILKKLREQDAESIRRSVLGYAQVVLLDNGDDQAAKIIRYMLDTTYDNGFIQLTYACYNICKTK
jgi:DNA polymerase-3 subunit gamma/tau